MNAPRVRRASLSACSGGLICARHSGTSGRQQTTTRGTMATTPADLFALFDRLGIEHSTVEHPPFFTVEEGRPWHDKIPGLHCKNLLIKDRKGSFWLVVMPADKRADLARLEKVLGSTPLLFRSARRAAGSAGIDARVGDAVRTDQRHATRRSVALRAPSR